MNGKLTDPQVRLSGTPTRAFPVGLYPVSSKSSIATYLVQRSFPEDPLPQHTHCSSASMPLTRMGTIPLAALLCDFCELVLLPEPVHLPTVSLKAGAQIPLLLPTVR